MNSTCLAPFGAILLAALALPGCGDKDGSSEGEGSTETFDTYEPAGDADGDGWSAEDGDCDDDDADLRPGRDEECNGIDDNCNGVVDEAFSDMDEDGTADCVDSEDCDGVDNDGDGDVDEGFEDLDEDGVADCVGEEVCDGIDNDADGQIDEDFDGDGDGYTSCGSDSEDADCDDEDSDTHPGASEADGDLADNDCDGLVDEGLWSEGDIFITEVMANPGAVSDPDGEWIEVYNATDRTLVMNGVIVSDTVYDRHQIDDDDLLLLEPGDHFVLCSKDDKVSNGSVDCDYTFGPDHDGSEPELSLSNESDDLIFEADGVTIDEISWDDGDTFPDVSGASMSLDPGFYGVDENDSGDNWCQAGIGWLATSDLGSPGEENEFCWPVAVAGFDLTSGGEYLCETIQLVGSGSYDPDGADLDYAWELTSAPSDSALTSADITTTTDQNPTFVADANGTYVFTLTVFNGAEYSQPSSISIDVSERPWNTDPVANAGEDDTYEEDSACTPISYGVSYSCDDCAEADFELSGESSTDPDGDWFGDPSWQITSGSSYATIADDDTWSPTVTVDGPSAVYGSDTSQSVTVELTVTDCMGATDTDEVMLTYTCTGT